MCQHPFFLLQELISAQIHHGCREIPGMLQAQPQRHTQPLVLWLFMCNWTLPKQHISHVNEPTELSAQPHALPWAAEKPICPSPRAGNRG